MKDGRKPMRVLVAISPPLLAETIGRLIAGDDVVACLDPVACTDPRTAAPGQSGPVELAITDHDNLTGAQVDTVLRLPGPAARAATATATGDRGGVVLDMADLAHVVEAVHRFAAAGVTTQP